MATAPNMTQITKAEIFHQEYRLPGYKLSFGTIKSVTAILLKLTDADGVFGWGEANPLQPFTKESAPEAAEVLHNQLLPIVLNESNPEPDLIDQILDAVQPGDHLLAKGAVTMALLDIKGKKLDVPVATLLGGAIRQSLPVLWPLSNGTAEEDMSVIDVKLKEGYTSFMLKMGTASAAEEIKRVATLEAHYGNAIKLIADANAGWTREQSEEFLEGVKDSSLSFIEQPVAKGDYDSMEKLTKSTKLLISVDESLTGMAEAKSLVRRGAANIFSIKSSKNGGPLRAKALSDLAKDHGILCYFNSMLEGGITQAASLHHAVTVTNLVDVGHAYMSTLRLEGDVTNFASFVDSGMVHLSEKAGWGINIDEDHLRRSAMNVQLITTE